MHRLSGTYLPKPAPGRTLSGCLVWYVGCLPGVFREISVCHNNAGMSVRCQDVRKMLESYRVLSVRFVGILSEYYYVVRSVLDVENVSNFCWKFVARFPRDKCLS